MSWPHVCKICYLHFAVLISYVFFFFFVIIAANEIAKEITTAESLKFDFGTIETATKKFSKDKKIGEGGFGEVYKVRDEHSFLDVLKEVYLANSHHLN
jgi:hypothetical protein